jgi:Ca2+-binding RTX toxin-like protein
VFTSTGGDTLAGTSGADTFNAGAAPATLTGGDGDDHFTFTAEPWAPSHIADFTVGHDVLDISALLKQAGYTGSDPVADHYVTLQSDGNGGTEVLFDPDGTATGHQWPDYIINLDHTVATSWADLQGAAASPPPVSPPPVSPPPVSPPPVSPPPVSPPPVTSGGQVFTSVGGDTLSGTAGADTFNAGAAPATLTGGDGDDHFTFTAEPWAPTHITDFAVGHDVLDLSALLKQAGYAGADPVADHYVTLQSDGNGGTEVLFDPDGSATAHQWPDYIINLDHTVATTWAQLQGAAAAVPPPPPASPPPASAGLTLTSIGMDTLVGGTGTDTLVAGAAPTTLTGGAGADHFVFSAEPWAPTHITDFTPGVDKIDISAMLKAVGYTGSNPIADHYISLAKDGHGGTEVLFDPDGTATAHKWPDYVIDIQGVAPSKIATSDWIIH